MHKYNFSYSTRIAGGCLLDKAKKVPGVRDFLCFLHMYLDDNL